MMRTAGFLLFVLTLLCGTPVMAQDTAPAQLVAAEGAAAAQPDVVAAATPAAVPVTVKAPFRDTLLFSGAEISALREAAAGRRSNEAFLDAEKTELIPIDRKIKLSGIYYKDDATWIVWLNGYKLHPRYLLKEIHRIEVKKDEVFLSWYDIGLNDVIDIRMRPHQIYDIVTGILYNDTAGGSQ